MQQHISKGIEDGLKLYLQWVVNHGSPFDLAITENLARYPVSIFEFITSDSYLGLKNVYPAVLQSLEEIYHPPIEHLGPLRIGTQYREVLLTGSLGCAKTYTSVLGILYGVYLLSCLRSPHALFGLDSKSEIVILFQSIRFQTGGVAYKLAREIVDGSNYFSHAFPKDHRVKNEILLPHNIVIRPVSGELTAAIGMNVATVLLDEMSFMRYHTKSVNAEDGGEYDQARALYNATRSRIDSRFTKMGRYLIPMWLAGSARHEEDFIQAKMRECVNLSSQARPEDVYIYNKKIWDIKPHEFPSGETFRVYRGKGETPPQIVESTQALYNSDHIIDVPVELETAFRAQPINLAMRDICGLPSREIGNFVVEVEKTRALFNRSNIFCHDSYTFMGGDLPLLRKSYLQNCRKDKVRFCHIDFSRTTDCTGLAIGYVEEWVYRTPKIVVEGILEIPPTQGHVVPWDAIINFIFRLSRHIPLYAVGADQVGHNYLREQLPHWGFKTCKISDNPSSDIYHSFINIISEGHISIANHQKTIDELLALVVDEKTRKVSKPAGGSKDCIDALVSLVEMLRIALRHYHETSYWNVPYIPDMAKQPDGSYRVTGGTPMFAIPKFD